MISTASEPETQHQSKGSIKQLAIATMKLGLVAAAIAYLVLSGKLKLEYLAVRLDRIGYLAIGVGLLLCVSALVVLRYAVLLSAVGIKMGWCSVLRVVLIGAFFNQFMLGGVGGDAVKAAYVMRDSGKRAATLASVVVDRALGLVGFLTMGAAALILSYSRVAAHEQMHNLAIVNTSVLVAAGSGMIVAIAALTMSRTWGFLACALLVGMLGSVGFLLVRGQDLALWGTNTRAVLSTRMALALLVGLMPAAACALVAPNCLPGTRFTIFIRQRVPLGTKAMNLVDALLTFRGRLGSIAVAFGVSVLMQFMTILSLYSFSRVLDLAPPPEIGHVFFAAPLAFVANMLPIPGGGLGVGENAFEWLLGLCIADEGKAIVGGAAIFLTWRFWAVIVSLAGLPLYMKGKSKPAVSGEGSSITPDQES